MAAIKQPRINLGPGVTSFIVPEDGVNFLTQSQGERVVNRLVQRARALADAPRRDTDPLLELPSFDKLDFEGGTVRATPLDEFTLKWLGKELLMMPSLWQGCRLRAVSKGSLPMLKHVKLVLLLPQTSRSQILGSLARQNPGLGVENWMIRHYVVNKGYLKNLFLEFQVSPKEFGLLKQANFKIRDGGRIFTSNEV